MKRHWTSRNTKPRLHAESALPKTTMTCIRFLCAIAFSFLVHQPLKAQEPKVYPFPAPPSGVQFSPGFGDSVAFGVGRIIVGVPNDDTRGSDSGAVKIFNSTNGQLVFVLDNPAPETSDRFGNAVAASGTLLAVGAYLDNSGANNSGSVYVFDLASATPTVPVITLINPSPAVDDHFGVCLAMSGSLLVVGAPDDDGTANGAGSAFVYDLSGPTPDVPIVTLNNPVPAGNDHFGSAVAISGSRVVIGAPDDDAGNTDAGSAYVYDVSDPTPTAPIAILNNPSAVASDSFGNAVAISGAQVAVGVYQYDGAETEIGRVYVYNLIGPNPGLPALTLNNPAPTRDDQFGFALAMSGTRLVVSANQDNAPVFESGTAYVFDLGSTTPTTPIVTLSNPTPAASDFFGWAVAIAGAKVLVGAPVDDTIANNTGSVYLFDLDGTTPTAPVATLNHPSPSLTDQFGNAVAVSGRLVAVGALQDDTGTNNAGAVYVYDLESATPTQPAFILINPAPVNDDHFGGSVAIDGYRLVVGAPDVFAPGTDVGIAYVYDLSSATPTVPILTLNNPSPAIGDRFGNAVAISGTRVVVGAFQDDALASNSGSVYVYDLSRATPGTPFVTLTNPTPAASDQFGFSVAITGVYVLVGANLDDTGATNAGSAYLYNISTGSPTVPILTLNNPTPAADDGFGCSVAISGRRFLIGAFSDDTGGANAGSAYLYDIDKPSPSVPKFELHNPSPTAGDKEFGTSVSISGNWLVVGAPKDDAGATDVGAAYLYDLLTGDPTTPVATMNNPSPNTTDRFGSSVSISGTTAAVGAPFDDTTAVDKGFAGAFDFLAEAPILSSPAPGVKVSSPLSISFSLPTQAIADSLKVEFSGSVTREIVLSNSQVAAGAHNFAFPTSNPTSVSEVASGAAIPDGLYKVTLKYTDGLSHFPGSTTNTDVLIDSAPPALTLPGAITLEAADATGAIAIFTVVTSDNLDPAPILSVPHPSGSKFPLGTTMVNVTSTDWAGNSRTEGFTVTVQDTTKPVLTVPPDMTVEATGPAGAAVNFNASANDTVSGVLMPIATPPSGGTFALGVTTVNIFATDGAGNTAAGSFRVTVMDTTKPVLTLPANIIVEASGANGAVVMFDTSASDAVSAALVPTAIPGSGSTFPIGVTTVNVSVTDVAGNTESGTFTVTVRDTIAPTIAGEFTPLTITTGADGTVALPDYLQQAAITDAVGVVNKLQTPPPGSARAAGTTTVTLTAHDAAGNTSSISFDVAVADGTKPEIGAPAEGFSPLTITAGDDGTAPLPDYTSQAATSDNVGVTSVTQVPAPESVRLFGKTTVTLTAHDAAGNTRDTVFDVFVVLNNPLLNTLAATGGSVPGAGVDVRIPEGAIFSNVGIPAIDDSRGVAFLGKWKSPTGIGAGIFAGNSPALIVTTGEDAPGIPGAKFKVLSDPVISPGGDFAFSASVAGVGIKPTNDLGVWMNTNGSLTLVLREGSQAPALPAGVVLKSVTGVSLRDDALLATVTLAPAKGLVTALSDTALLRITATGVTLMLREGQPLDLEDGTASASIKAISVLLPATGSAAHGRWHAAGAVVVRVTLTDQRAALLRIAADGTFKRLVATNDPTPAIGPYTSWGTLGLPAIESTGGASVMKGTLKNTPYPGFKPLVNAKNDTVLAFDDANGTGFTIFAREGESAAGVNAPAVFSAFQDPIVNANGDIAFIGTVAGRGITAKEKSGLWWGAPGELSLLARTGGFAPDSDATPTTATWTKFTSLALPDGTDAGPVFLAGLAGAGITAKNNVGLWAVDSTGVLRRLLRTGDIVDGKAVIGIHALTTVPGALGASRGFNARGAVVARILFTKGAQAVVRIDVPEGKVRLLPPNED